MAWQGKVEDWNYGIGHKAICPLLKQWRRVANGKATVESAGLREEMLEFLKAAVSAKPEGRAMAVASAGGDEGAA